MVYITLYIMVITFGLLEHFFPFQDKRGKKRFKLFYFLLIGTCFTLVSGIRYGIGFDFFSYSEQFVNVSTLSFSELANSRFELGYQVFTKLVSLLLSGPILISLLIILGSALIHTVVLSIVKKRFETKLTAIIFVSYGALGVLFRLLTGILAVEQVFFIVMAAVFAMLCLSLIYRHSKIPFISIALFLAFGFYITGMNLIRYAFSIYIYAQTLPILLRSKMDYSKENHKQQVILHDLLHGFLPYLILCLVSALFHKTTLLLIPLYFTVRIPFTKKTIPVGVTLIAAFFVTIKLSSQFISNLFFGGSYQVNVDNEFMNPGGFYFSFIPLVIFVGAMLLFKKLLERDKNNIVLVHFALYSLVFNLAASFFIFIITRVTAYFEIFSIFLIPELIATFLFTENMKLAGLQSETENADAEAALGKNVLKQKKEQLAALTRKKKDAKSNYVFGIVMITVLSLVVHYASDLNGSNGVFPYRSIFPAVNRYERLSTFGSRNTARKKLVEVEFFGSYLMDTVSDDNYIVFISTCGSAMNQPLYESSYEAMKTLGIDPAVMTNKPNEAFVLAYSGGNLIAYEQVSDNLASAGFEIDGHTVYLEASADPHILNSIIRFDQVDYSQGESGFNIVVYDKEKDEIVDSVNFGGIYARQHPYRRG